MNEIIVVNNRVNLESLYSLKEQLQNYYDYVKKIFQKNENKINEFNNSKNQSESIDKIKDLCFEIVLPFQKKYLEALETLLNDIENMITYYYNNVDSISLTEDQLIESENEVNNLIAKFQIIDDELNYAPIKRGFYLDMEAKVNYAKNNLYKILEKLQNKQQDLADFANADHFYNSDLLLNSLSLNNNKYYNEHPEIEDNIKLLDEIKNNNFNDIPNINDYNDYDVYLMDVVLYALIHNFATISFKNNEGLVITFKDEIILQDYTNHVNCRMEFIIFMEDGKLFVKPILTQLPEEKEITIPNGILGVEIDNIPNADGMDIDNNRNFQEFFSTYFFSPNRNSLVIDAVAYNYDNYDKLNDQIKEKIQNVVDENISKKYDKEFFRIYLSKRLGKENASNDELNAKARELFNKSINDLVREHRVHAEGANPKSVISKLNETCYNVLNDLLKKMVIMAKV